jgi:hypothetical protein
MAIERRTASQRAYADLIDRVKRRLEQEARKKIYEEDKGQGKVSFWRKRYRPDVDADDDDKVIIRYRPD